MVNCRKLQDTHCNNTNILVDSVVKENGKGRGRASRKILALGVCENFLTLENMMEYFLKKFDRTLIFTIQRSGQLRNFSPFFFENK